MLTNDPDHGLYSDYLKILMKLSKAEIFINTAVFCRIEQSDCWLGRHCNTLDTHALDNEEYRNLMLRAKDLGHEISFHGYSQVSNTRDEFSRGLDCFKNVFGDYPKVYVEHCGSVKKHRKEMCKLETLNYCGQIPDSEHYVKDIVKQVFDLVWTHDYLIDDPQSPMPGHEVFEVVDDVTYFKRSRMRDMASLDQKFKSDNSVYVGYTHFGYRGYERNFKGLIYHLLNLNFDQGWKNECWLGDNLDRNIFLIKRFLEKNSLKIDTIHNFFKNSKVVSKCQHQ